MAKKLTPQQIRVNQEKDIAFGSKMEDLLISAEEIKQKINVERAGWDASDKMFRKSIDKLELEHRRAQRLVRYKRDQIVSRKK